MTADGHSSERNHCAPYTRSKKILLCGVGRASCCFPSNSFSSKHSRGVFRYFKRRVCHRGSDYFFVVELLLETFKYVIKGKQKTAGGENVDDENCKLYYERELDRISYLASFLAIVCSENKGMTGGLLVAVSLVIIIFFACRAFRKHAC